MRDDRVDQPDQSDVSASQIPSSWRPRFGIRSMLLLMLIGNVLAAAMYYLARAGQSGGSSYVVFLVLILGGPPALLVVLSLFYRAINYWNRQDH